MGKTVKLNSEPQATLESIEMNGKKLIPIPEEKLKALCDALLTIISGEVEEHKGYEGELEMPLYLTEAIKALNDVGVSVG